MFNCYSDTAYERASMDRDHLLLTAGTCLAGYCWNVDVLFRPLNCHTYILWMTLYDDCAPVWHCCCTLVNTSVELYLHSTRQSIIRMVCGKVLLSSGKFRSEFTVVLLCDTVSNVHGTHSIVCRSVSPYVRISLVSRFVEDDKIFYREGEVC